MEYIFTSKCYKEGHRIFIKVPFNVWNVCGKKGNIPVQVTMNGLSFECKLIPKGKGEYVIPVNKDISSRLELSGELDVKFIILEQMTRINKDSPYSKENPIRQIDSIEFVKQPANGYCGQTCIAMLAGISVAEVTEIMKSIKWQCSISKVLETLDYFGFSYKRPVYTHGRIVKLPKCCIVNVRGNNINHLIVYFNGLFFDPSSKVMEKYPYENIISFIEIVNYG